MPRFLHKGMSCYFEEWGDSQKPALVLLHGFSQSSETWRECAPLLTKHRSVFALDAIGHGESHKPADATWYRAQEMHEVLDSFLDTMDQDSCDLLGYSMGGRIALGYACKKPQRLTSLILESTGLGCISACESQAIRTRNEKMACLLEKEGIEAFVEAWEKLPVFAPEKHLPRAVQKQLHTERLANKPQALAHSLRESGQQVMPDYRDAIAALSIPILYIAGTRDIKYADLARDLQKKHGVDATIYTAFFESGHNVHLELPHPYCKRVNEFLENKSIV